MPSASGLSTEAQRPKSINTKRPFLSTSRFPGCGSLWKKPMSSSCMRKHFTPRGTRRRICSGGDLASCAHEETLEWEETQEETSSRVSEDDTRVAKKQHGEWKGDGRLYSCKALQPKIGNADDHTRTILVYCIPIGRLKHAAQVYMPVCIPLFSRVSTK